MQKNDTYILGIDGGGTRTVICVADERYNILHRFESGALNVNGQTVSRLRETIGKIHQQLKQLNFKSDYCIEIGIGCAGITNPDASKRFSPSVFNVQSEYSGIMRQHSLLLFGNIMGSS